jgi:hypothetical protein
MNSPVSKLIICFFLNCGLSVFVVSKARYEPRRTKSLQESARPLLRHFRGWVETKLGNPSTLASKHIDNSPINTDSSYLYESDIKLT